jgi:hypothetical protein
MGRASVDLLLSSGPGGWADVQPIREMPTELVMRESTGVAAIERAPAGIAVPVGGALFDLKLPGIDVWKQRRKEH